MYMRKTFKHKMSKKRKQKTKKMGGNPDKKVLVLCQRKTGSSDYDNEPNSVLKVVANIEQNIVKKHLPNENVKIEYMSSMEGQRDGTVDYNFSFGEENSKQFVLDNFESYSLVILYSCPNLVFSTDEMCLLLSSIMTPDGILTINANYKNISNMIITKEMLRRGHFNFELFDNYFEQISNEMVFKKRNSTINNLINYIFMKKEEKDRKEMSDYGSDYGSDDE